VLLLDYLHPHNDDDHHHQQHQRRRRRNHPLLPFLVIVDKPTISAETNRKTKTKKDRQRWPRREFLGLPLPLARQSIFVNSQKSEEAKTSAKDRNRPANKAKP